MWLNYLRCWWAPAAGREAAGHLLRGEEQHPADLVAERDVVLDGQVIDELPACFGDPYANPSAFAGFSVVSHGQTVSVSVRQCLTLCHGA
jgi:hypothetical protein